MTWELKCDKCGKSVANGRFYVLLERFLGIRDLATNKGQFCGECVHNALGVELK
ncbi:MAG: hypothetical protein GYA60_01930 [Candidatus Methanofastidiosa archaeon]|nr:hypothetical protein [Candidatus Methanofastidiosa archaeon]